MLNKTIIFSIVAAFYSYIFTYLGLTVSEVFAPLMFIVLSIGLTTFMVLRRVSSLGTITKVPIYRWMFFYLIVVFIWVLLPNAQATQEDVRLIVLSVIFMFIISLLTSFDDDKLTVARKAILAITILATFNNITEFFNPIAFYAIDSPYNIFGRSAGFYVNANIAGEAIIVGLILSFSIVSNKFKTIFLIASLLGVVASFSRTAIASWFVVVTILSYGKVIDKKNLLLILFSLVFIVSVVLPFIVNFVGNSDSGAVDNLLTRLDFFSTKKTGLDSSQLSRLAVANAALGYFADSPLIGAGIGHTTHWEFPISTHNIYLKLMDEFGIIGIFIYPFLILSAIWRAKGETKVVARAFAVYTFIIGFTTHNSLDEYHLLIAFSIMANLSYRSRITFLNSPTSPQY